MHYEVSKKKQQQQENKKRQKQKTNIKKTTPYGVILKRFVKTNCYLIQEILIIIQTIWKKQTRTKPFPMGLHYGDLSK